MSFLREKVIFDTNKIRNTDSDAFLGGQDELKKFAMVSDIIVPSIVIEELRTQKRKKLKSNQDKFLANPFFRLLEIAKEDVCNFNSDLHLDSIEAAEEIDYTVIDLQDYSVLETIKDFAIRKLPPFEDKDSTDKGFKDAYIYFTILEYLASIPDKYVFVCSKDNLLGEALLQHPRIRVVTSFDEFSHESIASFYDDYFIEKLKEELSPFEDITKDNLIDYWFSIKGNHILLIEADTQLYIVEVDAGEIIECKLENKYRESVSLLVNSTNYSDTHAVVKTLKKYISFFSPGEAEEVISALFENDQISGAFGYGVKSFYWELFDLSKDILTKETSDKMSQKLDMKKTEDTETET